VLFFCFSCSFFATFHHTALITYSLHLPFSTVHHAEPIAMPFFSWKMLILLHFYWFLSYSNSHFNSPIPRFWLVCDYESAKQSHY